MQRLPGDESESRELLVSKGWLQAVALVGWPRSEAGKFHRGISLALVALAALIPTVVLVRHHEPAEALLLGAFVIGAALAGRSLVAELRAAPADPQLLA